MSKSSVVTVLAVTAMMAVMSVSASAADSRQKNKNLWRNGAIAGGAVALYGLHNHDTATTIAGVAGAAYSANRYEKDRRSQSKAAAARARARARYHARHHRYHHKVHHVVHHHK